MQTPLGSIESDRSAVAGNPPVGGPSRRLLVAAAAILLRCACILPPLSADTFVFHDGGRVKGQWLNASDPNADQYEIQLESGGRLVVDATQVKRIIPLSPEQRLYAKWLTKMPATAEGNWKMAELCAERRLTDERTFHLQETIRLDPNHQGARQALGFKYVDGEWILGDDLMTARGFVKHRGRWRLPQDIEQMQRQESQEAARSEWTKKLRLWRKWLGTAREPDAVTNLLELRDPLVAPLVAEYLEKDDAPARQRLWIKVLAKLPSGVATAALVRGVLGSSREVQLASLDELEIIRPPQAAPALLAALQDSNVDRVRRAATALQRLGDESAVVPLIHALVTQHKVLVSQGNPNQFDTLFSGGSTSSGTGFSTGSKPKVENRPFRNPEVLEALHQITGQDFQFDQAAWLNWYIQKESPPGGVSLRRES